VSRAAVPEVQERGRTLHQEAKGEQAHNADRRPQGIEELGYREYGQQQAETCRDICHPTVSAPSGRLLPGIDEGGRLYVRGPNIMLGYLKADHPGVLIPPERAGTIPATSSRSTAMAL
jgi:hypothetical protein